MKFEAKKGRLHPFDGDEHLSTQQCFDAMAELSPIVVRWCDGGRQPAALVAGAMTVATNLAFHCGISLETLHSLVAGNYADSEQDEAEAVQQAAAVVGQTDPEPERS